MRQTLILLTLLCAACRTSALGHCATDGDCPSGALCDSAKAVCVVAANACFPACQGGQSCDPATLSCMPDLTPPSVTVLPDTRPYARTATPIAVAALVTDQGAIPDGGVLLNGAQQPSSRDGGLFVFMLDPLGAPAGVEGVYTFTVTARDEAGNASAPVTGSRQIDDAPPAATVRIFKGTDPGGAGVIYPAAVPNTGWNGGSFLYDDAVHVKGTLTDLSGIASASLHVDGIALDGGTAAGAQTPLGCTAGATTCDFDVQVQLNLAQPEFHTGSAVLDGGTAGLGFPGGLLRLSIEAQDRAADYRSAPAAHAGTVTSPVRATRLLWQQQVGGAGDHVTGIAIHPNRDLIVTTDSATADTVYDLAPGPPAIRWHGATITGVPDQPAIGAGDGSTAPIYAADGLGNVFAFAPDGGALWNAITNAASFSVAPAVDSAAWTDGGTVEQVLEPDSDGTERKLWAASASTNNPPLTATVANIDQFSSPLVLGNGVFFGTGVGTAGNVTLVPLNGDGTLGTVSVVPNLKTRPYWGVITDGTSLFAATHRAATSTTLRNLYSIAPGSLAINWDTGDTAHLSAEPTLGIDGLLYASRWLGDQPNQSQVMTTVAPGTGAFGPALATVGGNQGPVGLSPLQGSDAHVYLPGSSGALGVYQPAGSGVALSWLFQAPAALSSGIALDCQGRLFVASGNTVYALITDDHGLADTAWPSRRRDARNTGNANAPRYGVRTASGCVQ